MGLLGVAGTWLWPPALAILAPRPSGQWPEQAQAPVFPSWRVGGTDLASWQEAPAAPGPWRGSERHLCPPCLMLALPDQSLMGLWKEHLVPEALPRTCCVTSGASPPRRESGQYPPHRADQRTSEKMDISTLCGRHAHSHPHTTLL